MGTGTFLAQLGEWVVTGGGGECDGEGRDNSLRCVNIVLVLDQTWQMYVVYFSFRRYLHCAFRHWSKQNKLSGSLIKSLMSHIDTEHNKVWILCNFPLTSYKNKIYFFVCYLCI